MADDLPSAIHTLCVVPELLPRCLSSWESRGVGIRQLRLVSKDVSMTAWQAVQSCSLQVGEVAHPESHEMAMLLSTAYLEDLTLTILVSSGTSCPLADQQLAACMSQLQGLKDTLQRAIQRVHRLSVIVCHTLHDDSTGDTGNTNDADNNMTGSAESIRIATPVPHTLEALIHTVLESLVSALPNLTDLSLGAGCGGSSLIGMFGSRCPQLSCLTVDFTAMPVAGLQNVGKHIPHLKRFTVSGDRSIKQLPLGYLQTAMTHLQHCASLVAVTVDSHGSLLLMEQPGWDLFPASVEEFSCSSSIFDDEMPSELCARLRRLTTHDGLGNEDLACFVQRHPRLTELTLTGSHMTPIELLHDDDQESEAAIPAKPLSEVLRQRFAEGFKLLCTSVSMTGPSEAVSKALAWLPALPSVTSCHVQMDGTEHVPCLEHLARVFPNLKALHFGNAESEEEESPVFTDAKFFRPLFECRDSLETLSILMHVSFTTKWLFRLCRGLPALKELSYMGCETVTHPFLTEALALSKRDMKVTMFSESDLHISEDEVVLDAVNIQNAVDGENH